MVKQKIQDAINQQINAEFQSAYTYLDFSAWFESKNLPGFAHWMHMQWNEEIEHAMKFYNHLIRRDGTVELHDITAPDFSVEKPEDVFEQALEQERNITKRIYKLYDRAKKEGDYPLETLLAWFIDEQVEEEDQVGQILDELKMIQGDGTGILLLDKKLGERVQEE